MHIVEYIMNLDQHLVVVALLACAGFSILVTALIARILRRQNEMFADTDGEDFESGFTTEDSWYQDDSVEETEDEEITKEIVVRPAVEEAGDEEVTKKIRISRSVNPEKNVAPIDLTQFAEVDGSSRNIFDPLAQARVMHPLMPVPVTVATENGKKRQIFIGLGPEISTQYLSKYGGPMSFRDAIMSMKCSDQLCLAALSGTVMQPTRVGDVYDAMFEHDDALGCMLRLHADWADDNCYME